MTYRVTEDRPPSAETNALQMIELPYAGGALSALVILPKVDDLRALIKGVTLESLHQWRLAMQATEVAVSLPRFRVESKYLLSETLKALGMPAAFSGAADYGRSADFSGMTGRRDLFIGDVIHQALVQVDEAGTEAAAATAVVMRFGAALNTPAKVFRADHPFLFIIQERSTGAILFIGSIHRPTVQP